MYFDSFETHLMKTPLCYCGKKIDWFGSIFTSVWLGWLIWCDLTHVVFWQEEDGRRGSLESEEDGGETRQWTRCFSSSHPWTAQNSILGRHSQKKQDRNLSNDALVWSAVFIDWLDLFEMIYELFRLTLFIWLVDWIYESNIFISADVCPISCISWLQISWDIRPELQYLMVADFMRYEYIGFNQSNKQDQSNKLINQFKSI